MKYGVIVYKNSNNIGDDIQSYAASCLLPQVDYYIEREHLDVFRPAEPEPVNVIMNGWFLYNKLGWPVSPCINPLYISMHFSVSDPLDIRELFLQGLGREDFLAHAPIGCRDKETQTFLEENHIPTWFSGCVTLTLNPIGEKKVQPYVCLTNVSAEVESYVREKYPQLEIRVISQGEPGMVDADASWEERFHNARELLKVYQNASAVITTRLHCAMPCLALQTPVLLLSEASIEELGRFDGLGELAHHADVQDYLAGKVDFDLLNPPTNPEDYQELRRGIQEKVAAFLQENQTCTPELKARYLRYDGEWERRALWKDDLALQLQQRAAERWKKDHDWLTELTASRDWFRDLYEKEQAATAALTDERKRLETQAEADRETIRQLEDQISQHKETIETREARLNEQSAAIHDLEVKIQNREAKIQSQKARIDRLRAEKEALTQQIWNLRHPVRRVANKLLGRK